MTSDMQKSRESAIALFENNCAFVFMVALFRVQSNNGGNYEGPGGQGKP